MVFSKIFSFAIIYLLIHLFKGKKEKANQEQYNHSELLLMLIPVSSVFIMFTFLAIGETSAFAAPVDFMVTTCAVFLLMVNLLGFGVNEYNQKKSQEFTDMQLLLQKESDSVAYYEMMLSQNENQYQRQCNDKHIALHTDIRSGTVQNIYQHDLTSLFCNLLDNAVESAEKIPDSFIELRVQKRKIHHLSLS